MFSRNVCTLTTYCYSEALYPLSCVHCFLTIIVSFSFSWKISNIIVYYYLYITCIIPWSVVYSCQSIGVPIPDPQYPQNDCFWEKNSECSMMFWNIQYSWSAYTDNYNYSCTCEMLPCISQVWDVSWVVGMRGGIVVRWRTWDLCSVVVSGIILVCFIYLATNGMWLLLFLFICTVMPAFLV